LRTAKNEWWNLKPALANGKNEWGDPIFSFGKTINLMANIKTSVEEG
jgi:hypothetical protein